MFVNFASLNVLGTALKIDFSSFPVRNFLLV